MQTAKLKKFATEARNILLRGVAQRLVTLGFQPDGRATEQPMEHEGGATFRGRTVSTDFYNRWMHLGEAIRRHGTNEVVEEAAYTWFNRLVAIRILARNEIISPVIEYESAEVRIPLIVTEARQGRMPRMDEYRRRRVEEALADDSRLSDQFRLLIVAFCHANPIINRCFGGINDYTELLLPTNILAEGGFVSMLNDTPFLTDADYRSPELIGWLYQFYISEKKDEVFAAKGKVKAEDIPAATQIFTPNWIVKYMVQNTVGRIYLDNNPYSDIKAGMKYLVEPSDLTTNNLFLTLDDVHDLKVADLACGSGHILNEMFDLLYAIYEEEGYDPIQAVEDIFQYNLSGIDIDTRAKQLATFALLLKACQKDCSFVDAHCMPRVMDMPQCDRYTWRDTAGHFNCHYSVAANEAISSELDEAFKLMEHANTLGSIMRFNISSQTADYLRQAVKAYDDSPAHTEQFAPLVDGMRLILALTQKYAALVMNPPYMGSGNMNAELSDYVKKNYPDGKADLFAVFMLVAQERLAENGKYGMINMQSWMFLSSFEKLRTALLDNLQIDNMLHLGPRTFDELSGEVVQNTAFVISNHRPDHAGTYFRLVDGKDCTDKERMFLAGENCYPNVSQKNFEKIPGCPIGYWVSKKVLTCYAGKIALSVVCKLTQGLATGDNAKFVKYWHEISLGRIGFGISSTQEALSSERKWFPYNKGGSARKWYGNQELVVDWENDGYEIKHLKDENGKLRSRPQNTEFYFKPSIAWSLTSSVGNAFRYFPQGFIFDVNGMSLFTDNIGLISYLNTKLCRCFLSIINPTLACQIGNVAALPYCHIDSKTETSLAKQNISISKQDWDAHETSWDFEENELLAVDEQTYIDNINWMVEQHFRETGEHICIDPAAPELGSLEWRVEQYKQKWTRLFLQLHDNEEQLNRQFIDIYGLQDELTPDVPLDEITILQQGEITIE